MEQVIIYKAVIDRKEAINSIQAIKNEQKSLRKIIEQMGETSSNAYKAVSASAKESGRSVSEVQKEIKSRFAENVTALKTFNKELKTGSASGAGSINDMREQLSKMTAQYDALSKEAREGQEGLMKKKNIKELSDSLKELEGETGRNQRRVGEYNQAVDRALDSVNVFGVNVGALRRQFKGNASTLKTLIRGTGQSSELTDKHAESTQKHSVAQRVLNASMKASKVGFNIIKVGIASTGIGLLLVAFAGLVAFFTKTERGAQKLKVIMSVMGSVVSNVADVYISLGEKIFKAIQSPRESWEGFVTAISAGVSSIKEQTVDRLVLYFKLTGQRIKSNILGIKKSFQEFTLQDKKVEETTKEMEALDKSIDETSKGIEALNGKFSKGLEQVKKKSKEAISEISSDAKKAAQIQQRENDLVLKRRNILLQNAKLETSLNDLRIVAADKVNLTERQRIDALEEALEISNTIADNNIAIATQELSILKERAKLAENTAEDNQQIADKEVEVAKLTAQRKQQSLRLERQVATERLAESTKNFNAELKILKAQGDETVRSQIEIENKRREKLLKKENLLEKEKQAIIAESNKKIADLTLQAILEQERIASESGDLALAKLETKYQKELLTVAGNEEKKKEVMEKYAKERIELTQSEVKSQIKALQSGLKDTVLSDEDKESLILNIETLKSQLASLDLEYSQIGVDEQGEKKDIPNLLGLDEKGVERLKLGFQATTESLSLLQSILTTNNQNKLQAIEKAKNKEVETVREQEKQGVISKQNASKQKESIESRYQKQKIDLEKKAHQTQKAFAISQAIINGALAITNILATVPKFDFGIASAIQIALASATTAAQVGIISSRKFAKGGIIKGKSHAQGGVPLGGGQEAEGGEIILTKGVTHNQKTRGIASYINQKMGGKDIGGKIPDSVKKMLDAFIGKSHLPIPGLNKSALTFARGGIAHIIPPNTANNQTISIDNSKMIQAQEKMLEEMKIMNEQMEQVKENTFEQIQPPSISATDINRSIGGNSPVFKRN